MNGKSQKMATKPPSSIASWLSYWGTMAFMDSWLSDDVVSIQGIYHIKMGKGKSATAKALANLWVFFLTTNQSWHLRKIQEQNGRLVYIYIYYLYLLVVENRGNPLFINKEAGKDINAWCDAWPADWFAQNGPTKKSGEDYSVPQWRKEAMVNVNFLEFPDSKIKVLDLLDQTRP